MKNFEIARLFLEMATLLEVREESRFRVRAYQRAAQVLETLTEDVAVVAARIEEYLTTGRIAQLEGLRRELPPTFLTATTGWSCWSRPPRPGATST